jgi:molybdopterin converting factor small subunit
VTVIVRLFGPQAALAGAQQLSVRLPGETASAGAVREQIALVAPMLAGSVIHSRVAVNHAFVADEALIGPDDEVALIGSVSGG